MTTDNPNQLALSIGDISHTLLIEAQKSQQHTLELLKQSLAASQLGDQVSINRNMSCYRSVTAAFNQELSQLIEATQAVLNLYKTGMIGRGIHNFKADNQN